MQRLGGYDLQKEIGRGGNGAVFRARDPRTGEEVAIKVIPWSHTASARDRDEVLARFRREAALATALAHPGIVRAREAGIEDGRLWLAMELVKGESLREFVSSGALLPTARVAAIVERIADALRHVHRAGAIHRDVTAENVFLLPGDAIKLLDFGVARVTDSNLTGTGEFLGSPHSISPEQMRGEKPTPASDQFSLAVLAFQMLTGEWPFPGSDPAEIFERTLNDTPRSVAALRGDLIAAEIVDSVLRRALATDPVARYASAPAFATALRECLSVARPRREALAVKRSGAMLAFLALTFLIPIGVLVFLSHHPWSRAEQISLQAEKGDTAGALAAVEEWRRKVPADPRIALVEGHVRFVAGERDTAFQLYRSAVLVRPAFAAEAHLLADVRSALEQEDGRESLIALSPLLGEGIDANLRAALREPGYWKRWNAARMLEARGQSSGIDYVPLYIADLESAGSCATRKRAAQKLGDLEDGRALPAIRAARDDAKNSLCFMKRSLDDAETAISSAERARSKLRL